MSCCARQIFGGAGRPNQSFLTVFDEFEIGEVDLHSKLLQEAHEKHSVSLNVAPQLPPPGEAPVVPKTIFPKALDNKLKTIKLVCPPSYAAPPLETCGTRGLVSELYKSPKPAVVPQPTEKVIRAKIKKDYKNATVSLPTAAEIDDLLISVWDLMGQSLIGEKFTAVALASAPNVDDRTPAGDRVAATPVGVAPAVKRMAGVPPLAFIPGKYPSMKEMAARYPSPFGDSEYSLMNVPEEPAVNPFLYPSLGAVESADPFLSALSKKAPSLKCRRPSLVQAAQQRRYACTHCSKTFRLLDGLVTHYEVAHVMEIPIDELRKYQKLSASAPMYSDLEESSSPPPSTTNMSTAAAPQDSTVTGTEKSVEQQPRSTTETPSSVIFQRTAVHIRAATNAVLVGVVLECKQGFIGPNSVFQFLVELPNLSAEGGTKEQNSSSGGGGEVITVRCFGESSNVFLSTFVLPGTQVLVHGILKLNRHRDDASKKLHAYPYIHVHPPLGNVTSVPA